MAGHKFERAGLTTLLALILTATAAQAQQQPEMPIEALLMRFQLRVWGYDASLPDFFAEEHVVSTRTALHRGTEQHATDSIFRLLRESAPDVTPPTISESREVRSIDGRAAPGGSVAGPTIFSGGFGNALVVVSMEMRPCFDYRVLPRGRLHRAPAVVIDYTLKASALSDDRCHMPEPRSGRAWFDPQSFQLLRIEMRVPNHKLDDGSRALWTWSADYAPVDFDGKLFWLPRTIISAAESNDGNTQWSFTATYRNYHKTNVTSRIITNLHSSP